MIGVDTTLLVEFDDIDSPVRDAAVALVRHEVRERGERLALTPYILHEYVHTITDPRRVCGG